MNKSNIFTILSKVAFLIGIAFFPLAIQSEVQASGKIVIRKTPGADVKVQTPDSPGFDSRWNYPSEGKKTGSIKITSSQIRESVIKDVPENPVEVETPENKDPHFTGYYQLPDNAVLINVTPKTKDEGKVMLPAPANFDANYYPVEVFLNGEARRIVVWNGKEDDSGEQLLICNDDLRSATGQSESVLSVMPLPGKPIEVYRARDSFDALHQSLAQKINFPKDPLNPDPVRWDGRITPYCLQTFEFKNPNEFLAAANAMVYSLYGDSAQLQIRKGQYQAIVDLFGKKYTWYAFDISLLRNWGTVSEPIAYRTKSKSVCIPLLDGKIGGADEGTVMKAIVITPCNVTFYDGLTGGKDVYHVGKRTAIYKVAELEALCPEVAEFCKLHKMEDVLVREFIAQNRITKYPGDFKMCKTQPPKPKSEVTPEVVDHQPGQPGANQQGQPRGNQPGQPGANQQGQPRGNQPGQPGVNQQGQPRGNQPGQPGVNQQTQPGYQQAQPRGNQPGQPGYQQAQPGYQQTQPGYQQTQPGYQQAQPRGAQPGQSGYQQTQPGANQPVPGRNAYPQQRYRGGWY